MTLLSSEIPLHKAVDHACRTLAIEWAANGVRVNAVAPGVIYSDTAKKNYGDTDVFEMARTEIPAKRTGKTQEVDPNLKEEE